MPIEMDDESLAASPLTRMAREQVWQQAFERGKDKGLTEGLEVGRKKGLAESWAKWRRLGQEEGRAEARLEYALRLLRWGKLRIEEVQWLTDLPMGRLLDLQTQIHP